MRYKPLKIDLNSNLPYYIDQYFTKHSLPWRYNDFERLRKQGLDKTNMCRALGQIDPPISGPSRPTLNRWLVAREQQLKTEKELRLAKSVREEFTNE